MSTLSEAIQLWDSEDDCENVDGCCQKYIYIFNGVKKMKIKEWKIEWFFKLIFLRKNKRQSEVMLRYFFLKKKIRSGWKCSYTFLGFKM
jgi:hypothetical protein